MEPLPSYKTLELRLDNRNVLYVSLNRPDVHNAFNEEMIQDLTKCATFINNNKEEIRIVVLTGKGRSFCAGADLNYMKKSKNFSFEDNIEDARRMSTMFKSWNRLLVPIVGAINGAAIGGGTGLVAACDIAIANVRAKFAFSEVNIGVIPAVISQYVVNKIGYKNAREFFLTGTRFDSKTALRIGLVNYVVEEERLDEQVEDIVNQILSSGPKAVRKCKELIFNNLTMTSNEIEEYSIKIIAELRTGDEGQEGITAFFEKRKPNWDLSQK